jgi:hypothetical protein
MYLQEGYRLTPTLTLTLQELGTKLLIGYGVFGAKDLSPDTSSPKCSTHRSRNSINIGRIDMLVGLRES